MFDATNKIIQRITRYANLISEQTGSSANRREEYAKIAELFLHAKDMEEAHRLSASIFGVESLVHLKGEFERKTDSMNTLVYEEKPELRVVTPRIRNYREKPKRSAIRDRSAEKKEEIERIVQQEQARGELLQALVVDDAVDFAALPGIAAEVREILLEWISRALEDNDGIAKTEDGRRYQIDLSESRERCRVVCEDGVLDMPHFIIRFIED